MSEAQLSPESYLEHAFRDQHNLVLLFGAACFSLAFASPLPLFVGAAGELLWLLLGPRLPAFRQWVDRERSAQYLTRAEAAIEVALRELTAPEVERFGLLSQRAHELASARAAHRPRDGQLILHGLLELRRTFLDYCFLSQRVEPLLEPTSPVEMETEAALLQQAYAAERELTARMTIRNALHAVQRRITEQSSLVGIQRAIALRLEKLEQILPQLAARAGEPSFELTHELDRALAEVGSAETLELAVDTVFASAARSRAS